MKKLNKFVSTLLICCLSTTVTFAQNLEWVNTIGGIGIDQGFDIAVDEGGNTFATGHFEGEVDFDSGSGSSVLTSTNWDAFLSKTNSEGELIWVRQIGGIQTEVGNSVSLDPSGNALITGYFFGTAEFTSGAETTTLTAVTPAADMFVAKYNTEGELLWAKQIGGDFAERGLAIRTDDEGNVYTTGYFEATTDFDPGNEAFILTTASPASSDAFILKLDTDGNFVWAKQLGGSEEERGHDLFIDGSGNVLTTGYFRGTAEFDPGSESFELTSSGNKDIYISKLDASGNFLWARHIGGSSIDEGNSIFADEIGNVFVTGFFSGVAEFDGVDGSFELTAAGTRDIFVVKMTEEGNLDWAKRMGGTGTSIDAESGAGIVVDSEGNVYSTGSFRGTTDFDPGEGVFELSTFSVSADTYISKLDPSGDFVWALQLKGNNLAGGQNLCLDNEESIYVIGQFYATVDFDPDPSETLENTAAGNNDIFILKLSQESTIGTTNKEREVNIRVYPNPTEGVFTIKIPSELTNTRLEVHDLSGKLLYTKPLNLQNSIVDITNHPSGVYLLTVRKENEIIAVEKITVR